MYDIESLEKIISEMIEEYNAMPNAKGGNSDDLLVMAGRIIYQQALLIKLYKKTTNKEV